MFVHTVLFSIAADASSGDCQRQLISACEPLRKIPTVRSLEVGVPVPSPRPVVDGSYSVGLLVTFDDGAGHDAYQTHPIHLAFVAQNKHLWNGVRIFDFA